MTISLGDGHQLFQWEQILFKNRVKESIIKYKIIYTILIILAYLVGRCIPLYRVDISMYTAPIMDAEFLIMQTIGGDMNRMSLFVLGVSPYMIATIIAQVINACRKSDTRSRISPKKMNKIVLGTTFLIAVAQALIQVNQLQFIETEEPMIVIKFIAMMEMIAGVMLMLWLCIRNKKYGIGGQTAIIFVNILDGVIATITGCQLSEMIIPFAVSAFVMIVVLIMENVEKQIPVQRISIHNIYADKNYLAIKLNPIGVMPVMFSAGFFMLPQILLVGLRYIFPYNDEIIWLQKNVVLTRPLGIIVYILILYILTIGFSFVFISPKDITEQFLKSGDSIVNLHAGRDTRRYLFKQVLGISFLSATIMGICLGVPMFLQLYGEMNSKLVMLPSSVMMLTGIWCNLYREIIAVKNYDLYRPFI